MFSPHGGNKDIHTYIRTLWRSIFSGLDQKKTITKYQTMERAGAGFDT